MQIVLKNKQMHVYMSQSFFNVYNFLGVINNLYYN